MSTTNTHKGACGILIKNILFDLDDTLLDFHKAEAIAIEKTLIHFGVEPDNAIIARYSEINSQQWRLLEEGKLSRDEVLVQRFRILFSELGVDCPAEKAREIYEHNLGIGHYFMDGALELLESLYLDYNLYLVSNGTTRVQEPRIESAGIAKYFKELFISQKIGVNKPDAAFFEFCFKVIPDFSREETIIIGDRLSSDIKGGNNAGIRTCWFNPNHDSHEDGIQVDFEITHLEQVPLLIKSIANTFM